MIYIQYVRVGLIVVAMNVDDAGDIRTAKGFTENHARKRLVNKLHAH